MLEGEILPLKLLKIGEVGKGVYWSTRCEKKAERNEMGGFSYLGLKERGLLIYGKDITTEFDNVSNDLLTSEINNYIRTIKEHGRSTVGCVLSVEWLFMETRAILWIKERRLSSKSESALWAYNNCKGEWRKHLPKAIELRKNPGLANEPETSKWLGSLENSIQEACAELEKEYLNSGVNYLW